MLKLNLACGARPREGCVNIDIVARPGTDIVADCLDLRDHFADGTVDEVQSEDFVEHLTREQLDRYFAECARLLRVGGLLRIKTIDLGLGVRRFTDAKNDLDWLDSFLYARHLHEYDYHRQGIYREKLERLAVAHGFAVTAVRYHGADPDVAEIVVEAVRV